MTAAPAASAAERIVQATTAACRDDPDVRAALTYGSIPQGLGDAHSDAEFWIFLAEAAYDRHDAGLWIARVCTPVLLCHNEFGADVAICAGLLRAEFHFHPVRAVDVVRDWPARGANVDAMVLVDHAAGLRAALRSVPERAVVPGDPGSIDRSADVAARFANWWVLGRNVLERGENERAVDALAHVRRHLLWLLRLRYDATAHWLTPSRRAEVDLPAAELDKLRALSDTDLPAAYAAAWRIGARLWAEVAPPGPPAALVAEATGTADP